MHPNKAIVAVVAKIGRVVWVIITKPSALYVSRDQRFGQMASQPDCEAREVDDETLDQRRINTVQKIGFLPVALVVKEAFGSHHCLAATAVYSREARYIYATVWHHPEGTYNDGAGLTYFLTAGPSERCC